MAFTCTVERLWPVLKHSALLKYELSQSAYPNARSTAGGQNYYSHCWACHSFFQCALQHEVHHACGKKRGLALPEYGPLECTCIIEYCICQQAFKQSILPQMKLRPPSRVASQLASLDMYPLQAGTSSGGLLACTQGRHSTAMLTIDGEQ